MMDYLKNATVLELLDDVFGAIFLFALIFISPYLIALFG